MQHPFRMHRVFSERPFRWALAGYGDLAEKRVAAALKASGSLAAVWGRNPDKTTEFANRHEIPLSCKSGEALVSQDVDAVYICTPPETHAPLAQMAAKAGKHVMVEKPMALNTVECEAMQKAARENAVQLGVAYYRRSYPKMIRIRELIREGAIGVPVWVNIATHSWFDPAKENPQHWRVEKQRSGGAGSLADIGVHRLDLLDYWLGSSEVTYASFTHLIHSYEVEDSSTVCLRLANGAPVHLFCAWNSKVFMDRFEITGTEGKIIAEPLDGPELTVIRGREREECSIPTPENFHLPCVRDFIAACQEGRSPLCDGETGARTSALVEQAIQAAQTRS
ncbi:MAG: Gfo/Idh/MocA family oxidoreductase [Chthoniobacterales bacterium]